MSEIIDARLSRRTFLGGLAATTAGIALGGCTERGEPATTGTGAIDFEFEEGPPPLVNRQPMVGVARVAAEAALASTGDSPATRIRRTQHQRLPTALLMARGY